MKKIKGGKRKGAGRKATGRNTQVISFSVPKDMVDEIKEIVKKRLAQKKSVAIFAGPLEEKPNGTIQVEATKEDTIRNQIMEYEMEIKGLGTGLLGIKRKRFLESKISELVLQLKHG